MGIDGCFARGLLMNFAGLMSVMLRRVCLFECVLQLGIECLHLFRFHFIRIQLSAQAVANFDDVSTRGIHTFLPCTRVFIDCIIVQPLSLYCTGQAAQDTFI